MWQKEISGIECILHRHRMSETVTSTRWQQLLRSGKAFLISLLNPGWCPEGTELFTLRLTGKERSHLLQSDLAVLTTASWIPLCHPLFFGVYSLFLSVLTSLFLSHALSIHQISVPLLGPSLRPILSHPSIFISRSSALFFTSVCPRVSSVD